MNAILKDLIRDLDPKTRDAISRRLDALVSGLRYEEQNRSANYINAQKAGWSIAKIEVLCVLNAFYQIVLGPLTSVAQNDMYIKKRRGVSISYGKEIRLTCKDIEDLQDCHSHFIDMTNALKINGRCLQSACAQDLLYTLSHVRETS